MSKQLDRFFKEKLDNHQVPPSDVAWDKVEASLNKEKKGIVWFRAAAAIVLLGVLTVTLLWVRSGEETTIAKVDSARVAPKPKSTTAPKKKQSIQEPKLPVVRSQSRKTTVFIAQEENKKEEIKPEPSVQQDQPVAIVSETPSVIQQENPEVTIKKPAITLTYTLAQIPSRKDKTQTPEEKNGLQKAVDVAMDAKNSDGAIAEIRTLKDDLFALNFKKNNKK
jgi:hypothetical protein